MQAKNKLYVINKIFNSGSIRTVWDKNDEKYYISVVDVVGVLSESENPRNYWKVLKHRLKKEGNDSVTNCNQLKLKASDGKYYNTDVVDIEGMFRIVESMPSKNAEPIKQWLAKLGKERIDEVFEPSLSIERAIEIYRAKGYDDDWIIRRIKGIQERKKLTDVWKENGVDSNFEFAMLTNEIYRKWSGMTSSEYKEYKGLRKENLRDNMSDIEVLLTDIGELTTRELVKKHKPYGFKENVTVAQSGGEVAKITKEEMEKRLGMEVVIRDGFLLNKDECRKIDFDDK